MLYARAVPGWPMLPFLKNYSPMECILKTSEHFGKQLRSYRKAAKISQVALAKEMECTPDNICHFEKGDNTYGNGSIQTVFKYVRALKYKSVKFIL